MTRRMPPLVLATTLDRSGGRPSTRLPTSPMRSNPRTCSRSYTAPWDRSIWTTFVPTIQLNAAYFPRAPASNRTIMPSKGPGAAAHGESLATTPGSVPACGGMCPAGLWRAYRLTLQGTASTTQGRDCRTRRTLATGNAYDGTHR